MRATPNGTKYRATILSRKPVVEYSAQQRFFFPYRHTPQPFFSPATLQPKLTIGQANDTYEQQADAMAEKVVQPSTHSPAIHRKCTECAPEEKPQRTDVSTAIENKLAVHKGQGESLPGNTKDDMEAAFGVDFSGVKVHRDQASAQMNSRFQSKAFTHGSDIYFDRGQFDTQSLAGKGLLAHELTHVVQQSGGLFSPAVQRQPAPTGTGPTTGSPTNLSGPLTPAEWSSISSWLSRGEVGIDPLTADPVHNAKLVAASIFCSRMLFSNALNAPSEDPLLCVLNDVTIADPRVQSLIPEVTARGPIMNWAAVGADARLVYVMERLIDQYSFPVNGAAGLVGNLWAESGVLPSRIEGSAIDTPVRARDFQGNITDFSPAEVMHRSAAAKVGPRMPGIGLAQWTSAARRTDLFQHQYAGRVQGADILFNMDAQIDYLVTELQANYTGVYNTLTGGGISLDDASDEVVYRFEVPGSILAPGGGLRPRTDPAVQAVFGVRRASGQRALTAYRHAHPTP